VVIGITTRFCGSRKLRVRVRGTAACTESGGWHGSEAVSEGDH